MTSRFKVGVWFPKSRLVNGNAPIDLIRQKERELSEKFRGGLNGYELDGASEEPDDKAYLQQKPKSTNSSKGGTILNVPYKQRNIAKQFGAKWDSEQKTWYIPEGEEVPPQIKYLVAQDSMCMMAQDRSMRSYDEDGRLHVETSNISKATVNPYYGSEIPNHDKLGLEPTKVYYMLRAPEELEKAVQTFNNLPLLSKHIPVSADEPQKDVIVGTTGSDAKFEDGYLKCSLAVWDSEAIAGIESGEQMELSSAYRYVADMTPGEFKGMRYDGVMRDIVGNHVALVDVGRAGRDVVVSDADPFSERKVMKLKKGAKARIHAVLKPLMAQDAELSPDELLEVIGSLTNEVQTAEDGRTTKNCRLLRKPLKKLVQTKKKPPQTKMWKKLPKKKMKNLKHLNRLNKLKTVAFPKLLWIKPLQRPCLKSANVCRHWQPLNAK